MKNSKKIIILIACICVAILILLIAINIYNRVNIKYYIIYGYSSIDSQIISSYEEYQLFVEKIENSDQYNCLNFDTTQYDSNYFKSKAIAIINIITGSSDNKFNGIKFKIKFNTLICDPDITYARGTQSLDINGKVYLVEISNNVTEFEIK